MISGPRWTSCLAIEENVAATMLKLAFFDLDWAWFISTLVRNSLLLAPDHDWDNAFLHFVNLYSFGVRAVSSYFMIRALTIKYSCRLLLNLFRVSDSGSSWYTERHRITLPFSNSCDFPVLSSIHKNHHWQDLIAGLDIFIREACHHCQLHTLPIHLRLIRSQQL